MIIYKIDVKNENVKNTPMLKGDIWAFNGIMLTRFEFNGNSAALLEAIKRIENIESGEEKDIKGECYTKVIGGVNK